MHVTYSKIFLQTHTAALALKQPMSQNLKEKIAYPFVCPPPRMADPFSDSCPVIDASRVAVAQDMWICYNNKPPEALLPEIRGYNAFDLQMANMWMRDPVTQMVLPYWLPPQVQHMLALAQNGSLSSYPMPLLQWLHESRITMPPGAAAQAAKQAEQEIAAHRESLRKHKYTVLRNLFPKPMLRAMAGRMRYLQDNELLMGCTQVPERTRMSDEPAQTYFHFQLENYLNRIMVEEPLKASYVFTAIYHEGSVLKRHVDRPQCRWNLSVVLDATPEVTMDTCWPIYMEIDGEAVEVRLLPGDGVFYSGTDIPHWRDMQPSGLETMVSFYHFVDRDFNGQLK